MGAQGLFGILRFFMSFLPLAALAGQSVGIDASFLIHVILARQALAILQSDDWSGFEREVDSTVEYLLAHGIQPLFVFDGRRDPLKRSNSSRAEKRSQAYMELQLASSMVQELCEQLKTSADELVEALAEGDGAAAASIAQQQDSAAQAVNANRQASMKKAAAAIGSRAVEAAERMRALLIEHKVSFQVALYEAESHLRTLQTTGAVVAVIAFDADYATIGTDYALMDPTWRHGGGSAFIKDRVPTLAKKLRASSTSAAAKEWADIVCRFGWQSLRQTSYFLKNDYTHIKNVGQGTIRTAWLKLVASTDSAAAASADPSSYVAKLPTLTELAAAVHQAASDAARKVYPEASDMLQVAQHAAFMFHHQLVLQCGVAQRPELPADCEGCSLVYDRAAARLNGVDLDPFFDGCSAADLQSWLEGQFDVSAEAFGQPATPRPPRHRAAPSDPAAMDALHAADFAKMKLAELKALAAQCGLPAVSGLSRAEVCEALDAHRIAVAAALARSTAAAVTGPSADDAALNARRAEVAQKILDTTRELQWAALPTSPEQRWATSENVTAAFLVGGDKIDSHNSMEIQCFRQVLNIECAVGNRLGTLGGPNMNLYEAFVRGDVQASLPADLFREVYIQLLISEDSSGAKTVLSIAQAVCVPPKPKASRRSVAEASSSASQPDVTSSAKSDEKLCRGGRDCLHTVALVSRLQEASTSGSTDGVCTWKRPKKEFKFAAAPLTETLATLLPADHHIQSRMDYFALDPKDTPAILQGIGLHDGDPDYRKAYDKFRLLTLEACKPDLAVRGLRADCVTGHGIFVHDVGQLQPVANAELRGFGARPRLPLSDAGGAAAAEGAASGSTAPAGIQCASTTAGPSTAAAPSAGPAGHDLPVVSPPGAPAPAVTAEPSTASTAPSADAARVARRGKKSAGDTQSTAPLAKRAPIAPTQTAKRSTTDRTKKGTPGSQTLRPCICAAGAQCKSIGEGVSRFSLPRAQDEREKWLLALYPEPDDADKRAALAAQTGAKLYAGHFPAGSLQGGNVRNHPPKSVMPSRVGRVIDAEALEQARASREARRVKCVCSQDEATCGEEAASGLLFHPPNDPDLAMKWLRTLCPSDSKEAREAIQRGGFLVAAHHFKPEEVTTVNNQYGPHARPKVDAVPRFQPYTAKELMPKRPKLNENVKAARQLLAGTLAGDFVEQVVSNLLDEKRGLQEQIRQLEVQLHGQLDVQLQPTRDTSLRTAFLKGLATNDALCHRFTGQQSYKLVQCFFYYLNAKGALDRVLWWREDNVGNERRRSNAGRPRTLSTFESFVFFLCVIRYDLSASISPLFEVDENTGQRTYVTMLNAVAFILTAHQPWPRLEQVRRATPLQGRSTLEADSSAAIFLGDCVERRMVHPTSPEMQFLTWSDYKQCHTGKQLAIADGNGFMCELTPMYGGRTRDNEIIAHSSVGERLAGGPERLLLGDDELVPAVLLYDKGYTQVTSVQKHGVYVLQPRSKRRGQLNFDEDAPVNKKVAKFRAPIEKLFANAANYSAFTRKISIGQVDLADLAAQVVRCLCNLTPPPQDWELTGDFDFDGASTTVQPDVEM